MKHLVHTLFLTLFCFNLNASVFDFIGEYELSEQYNDHVEEECPERLEGHTYIDSQFRLTEVATKRLYLFFHSINGSVSIKYNQDSNSKICQKSTYDENSLKAYSSGPIFTLRPCFSSNFKLIKSVELTHLGINIKKNGHFCKYKRID